MCFATVLVRQYGAIGIFYPMTFALGVEEFPEDTIGLVVDVCHKHKYEVNGILTTFKKEQVH